MTRISAIFAAALLAATPMPALATDPVTTGEARDQVVGCLHGMDATTTWGQCLNQMFAPCAELGIGTREHAACLLDLREDWRQDMVARQTEVLEVVTLDGAAQLAELLAALPTYIEQKCTAVAEDKAEISEIAARLGCEVSEMALVTAEFQACQDGTSPEDYCIRLE